MRSLIKFFAIVFIVTISSGLFAQSNAKDAYVRGKACYEDVKTKNSKVKADWEKCADIFEKANMAFPRDTKGIDALYSAAKIKRDIYTKFSDKKDVEASLALYNKIVKEYPKNSLADDALYQIASIRHDPFRENARAKKALEHLLANYPDGDMVPKAKVLLAKVDKDLASSSVQDGEPQEVEGTDEAKVSVVEEPLKQEKKESAFASKVAGPMEGAFLTEVKIKNGKEGTNIELLFNRSVAYSVEFTEEGPRTRTPPKLELTLSYVKSAEGISRDIVVDSDRLYDIKIRNRILGSGIKMLFTMKPDSDYEIIPDKSKITLSFKTKGGSKSKPKASPAPLRGSSDEPEESKKKS